ncbi:thioredoxin family protein [Pseudochrobactrum kiredjianiae]|uniref:Thioredoxin family protein n=1 Tax=Pseudochrobactrum kiredjianiae TaxID=386305 RepID=A0ABW3V0F2_9HYPH|nr:thioredoxin family protein [Pseudochrobactrum kiredjianiae]MDM7852232.1 thioredoxin family protein [Pseudochrobactrum kiredjianiae]
MSRIIRLNINNFSRAIQNPQSADGLGVIYFSATWCQPCKNMMPVFQQLVQEMHQTDILFGEVDVAEAPTIVQSYGLRSVPSIAVFKYGQLIKIIAGEMSLNKLRAQLQRNFPL